MIEDVIRAISDQAVAHPDRVAYDYLGQTYTYQELETQSTILANHLTQQFGVDNQQPILVYGGQTFDMIVAFLGAVKSGHGYIPVDVHSASERITSILETAQPALVIAVEPLPVKVAVPVLTRNDMQTLMVKPVTEVFNNPIFDDETFYIIFTSGTTGKPKGVQISHQNLISFVNWMTSWQAFEDRNTLLQPAFSFDLSVMGLYPTLVSGGTLKVLPKNTTDNFAAMFQTLPTLDLNTWISTPSLIDICLLDPSFDQAHYPTLDRFLFCGEELTHQTAMKLKQQFPAAKVFNTYGPTEATVAVTSVEITADILATYDRLPIGYVKPDTQILIDNDHADGSGELLIAGPGVSKGYLNNPVKTEAAFYQQHTERGYRSGDLGYYKGDLLFYNGRTDFQIKLNGYRIELEEVNHHLASVTMIKQGVAVPKYDRQHKVKQLVAIVVLDDALDQTQNYTMAIKQQLSQDMMPYMVPQRFIFKKQLPLSANGKVDIKALIAGVNPHD